MPVGKAFVKMPKSACFHKSRMDAEVYEKSGSALKFIIIEADAVSPALRTATYENPSQYGRVAQSWQSSVLPQDKFAIRVAPGMGQLP